MLYIMCAMIIAISITTAAILIKGASQSKDITESFIDEEKTKDNTEAKRKKDADEKATLLFFLKDSNRSDC